MAADELLALVMPGDRVDGLRAQQTQPVTGSEGQRACSRQPNECGRGVGALTGLSGSIHKNINKQRLDITVLSEPAHSRYVKQRGCIFFVLKGTT